MVILRYFRGKESRLSREMSGSTLSNKLESRYRRCRSEANEIQPHYRIFSPASSLTPSEICCSSTFPVGGGGINARGGGFFRKKLPISEKLPPLLGSWARTEICSVSLMTRENEGIVEHHAVMNACDQGFHFHSPPPMEQEKRVIKRAH